MVLTWGPGELGKDRKGVEALAPLRHLMAFAGVLPPDQTLISKGVAAAEDLEAEARLDTAWSLRLIAIKTKVGPSGLSLEALWTNGGRQAVRIRLPSSAKPPSGGILELTWSAPPSREPGVTPLPPDVHRAFPKASQILSRAWKEIGPGDTARLPVAFSIPFSDSKWKGTRIGRLTNFGLDVAESGESDTLPVTLFSGNFPF